MSSVSSERILSRFLKKVIRFLKKKLKKLKKIKKAGNSAGFKQSDGGELSLLQLR
jgi:hypothetical protein